MNTPLTAWTTHLRHGRVWGSLALTLLAGTGAWAEDARLRVAVAAGQLSVNLQEAPMREVLTAIGRQAGLHVRMESAAPRTVTAQFTAMDVEAGLRRLLRAAALSYALEYSRGTDATATLQAVRVFGAAARTPKAFDPARPAPDVFDRVDRAEADAFVPQALEPDDHDPDAAVEADSTHDWQD
jgi:hypothetical protein